MAAIRAVVVSLSLLGAASPAAAQFSSSDLNGTWLARALVAGPAVDNGAGFATGTVTFNASGAVTGGSLTTALGAPFRLSPGSLTVEADGRIRGTLGVGTDDSTFEGRLVRDSAQTATRIVGTLTRGFGTPTSRSMLVVMSRAASGTTFAQDPDASGTWRVKSLLVPDLPLAVPDLVDGVIVVEQDGTINGGALTSLVNETTVTEFTGTLRLDAAGNVSGTLTIPEAETSTFSGWMTPDKTLVVASSTRQFSETRQFGLFELTRVPNADAPVPQLQPGTWELFSLQVREAQGTVGESLGGTIELGPNGTIVGGALIGLDGQVDTIVEGSYGTPSPGEVFAQVVTEIRTLTITGALLPGGNQILGGDILDMDGADHVGFVSLARAPAVTAPPASTVEFRLASATQRVTEGGTVTLFVDRSRATTSEVTVRYAVTGGSASPDDYDLSGGGTLTFKPGETTKSFTLTARPDGALEGDETVTISLLGPTGGAELGRATATVTIADNAVVQFSQASFSVKENVASALVTVVRGGGAGTAFTVPYTATAFTAAAGKDFRPVSGTLSFAATTTSRQFSVPILNNTLMDGNRSVQLTLGVPTNGARIGALGTTTLVIQDDEAPGAFKLDAGTYTVLETAKVLPVKVLRTETNLAGNVTVLFRTVPATAVDGVNYTAVSSVLTFTSGQTSKTVNVPILRDFVVAPSPRIFTVELSAPGSGATLAAPFTAPVTITEADAGGVIKFNAAKYSVAEGAGNVTLTVVRTGGTAGGVSVDYVTNDGTAVSGEGGDFTSRSGTLSFASGSTSATITIPIRQDSAVEGDEIFTVELRNPRGGATLPAPPATGRVATVTIVDDETAVQFSGRFMGNYPEVVRSGQMNTKVTVNYVAISGTAIAGQDFLPLAGTLTFNPGVRSQWIPLVVVKDIVAEGPETFTIQLSNPQPVGGLKLGLETTMVFTITDDDFGGTNVRFDAPSYSGDEGKTVTLTVRRDGGLGTILNVNWHAVGGNALAGVDFSPAEGIVTFPSAASAVTFSITLASDALVEGPEFALLALSMPAGAATLGEPATATLTIVDRTPAPIHFESASYAVLETAGAATITLVREGGLEQAASVHYATVAGGSATAGVDYTALAGTITFAPGAASAHFEVPIMPDILAEGPETVTLALSAPSAGFALGPRATAELTITDAALLRFSSATYTVTESAGAAEITVQRSGNLALAVTVDYATTTGGTAGPADFSPVSGTLSFAPGAASATFVVPVLDDRLIDGTKTVNVALSRPGAGAGFLGAPTATIVISDVGTGYTFTEIATTSGDGFSSLALPSINDRGVVAYSGTRPDGTMEIRTSDDSIVLASDPTATIFPYVALNDGGHLAFGGILADGRQGVFRASPDTVSIMALSGSLNGEFRRFGPASLNNNGDLVFSAEVIGGFPVLVRTEGARLATVADANGDTFASFPAQPVINDAGVVLFPTFLRSEESAVYRADGELTPIAEGSLLDADFQVGPSSLNSGGQAALIAKGRTGGQRVLRQDDTGQLVTAATTASGAYANLSQTDNSPAINDAGMVAFWATLSTGEAGIFTGAVPSTSTVIRTGDPLFGSTVVELQLGGLNNRGALAFRAVLANGRQVIGVATPPEP